MQTVYRENPKLGNIADVEKQMTSVNQELDALNRELQKFKVSMGERVCRLHYASNYPVHD